MRLPRFTVALVLMGLAVAAACSKNEEGGERCTPGKESYCRCQDGLDGTKVCKEDGAGFSACSPCPNDPDVIGADDDSHVPIGDDVGDDAADAAPTMGCGNGAVDTNEECDDGNATTNDGCSPTCTVQGAAVESGACPATPVDLWGAASFDVDTRTAKKSFQTKSTTGTCPKGSASPDRAYLVTMHKKGTFTATASGSTFDDFVYLIKTTTADTCTAVEAACKNDKLGTGIESVAMPVEVNDKVFVVVDGVDTGVAGTLTLSLTVN